MNMGKAGVRASHGASAADHVSSLRGALRRSAQSQKLSLASISISAWPSRN